MSQTKFKMPLHVRQAVVWLCKSYVENAAAQCDGRARLIRAVDAASEKIGADIKSPELRKKLKAAIWESTLGGRSAPYESFYLPCVCRDEFYERKRAFLRDVAVFLELL